MILMRLIVAVTICLMLVVGVDARRAKESPCAGGRFVVAGDPLMAEATLGGPDAITVEVGSPNLVSTDSGCPETKAVVRKTRRGTRVGVRWPRCGGVAGRVRLRALFAEDCASLSGTLRGRSQTLARDVVATRSTCGDGMLDVGAGEACEDAAPCGDDACVACQCVPESPTTTTTSITMASSTTTTTTSTTTTTTSSTTTTSTSTSSTTTTVVVTFDYTGTEQTFVVGPDTTSIRIELYGAQGGTSAMGVAGGLGGYASGTLAVTPGSTLYVYVGSMGGAAGAGGFNGGGNSGASPCANAVGGGGGGGSDLRQGGNTIADRVIIAGGGGGAGGDRIASCGRGTGGGGGGGYYGGGGGAAWPFDSTVLPTGGTQLAGGTAGTSTWGSAPNNNGHDGALGTGGAGGDEVLSAQGGSFTASSGGSGGGLVGADGTFPGSFVGQSGAGGSSYLGAATDPSTTSGQRTGDGLVVITY
jgi:hypothetical protein